MSDIVWDLEVSDMDMDAPPEGVAYIELGTKNSEVFDISLKDVVMMELDGITSKDVLRVGTSMIERSKSCEKAYIKLAKKGDIEKNRDGEPSNSVYQRLEFFNDIVDIAYLNANKEVVDRIYVPWDEEGDEEMNGYSRSDIDVNGNLTIEIKRR